MAKIIAIKLTAETKKVQKALQEINLTLEQQEDLINDTQRQIDKLEDKRDKTSKKDITRIKRYNEQIKEQNKNLKRSKQRLTEQKQAQQKTNKALKESIKDSKDYSGILGVIDKNTGGAISGFSKMIKGINGATKGFNLMKVAIIGTGIGALVIGIVALVQSFKRSEAGQEKFQRGMAMIGAVVKQVLDLYAKLGETIIESRPPLTVFSQCVFCWFGSTVRSAAKVMGYARTGRSSQDEEMLTLQAGAVRWRERWWDWVRQHESEWRPESAPPLSLSPPHPLSRGSTGRPG